jgi:FlaA1/EpsC-like NDP-sugar epimerase
VLLIDIGLIALGFVITHVNIELTSHAWYETFSIGERLGMTLCTYLAFFLLFKTYHGVIRFSTFHDIFRLSLVILCSTVCLLLVNYTWLLFFNQKIFLVPFLAINMVFNFGLLLFFRISIKGLYGTLINAKSKNVKNVAIVGISEDAISLGESMISSTNSTYSFSGFVSLSKKYKGVRIFNKKVYYFEPNSAHQKFSQNVDGLIFINPDYNEPGVVSLIDYCIDNQIEVLKTDQLFSFNADNFEDKVKALEIEDLLPRETIEIDNKRLDACLEGSTILVTGGAGSIGSEIVRQLIHFAPSKILIVDQAESALYDLELELSAHSELINCVVASICDNHHMRLLLDEHPVSIIFHAAAYKHVPLMERNPVVAADVNTLGTINLASLATEYNVEKFVFVSTDKAVNPTNVMGASKRAAEMYLHALHDSGKVKTKFITTRFGNVLGSNGSVIPHFKKQIASKGPVTVTHRDIIRYFMTIPEACQLVLQAGAMGTGGEVFVFDMGEPVRILDLAEKMIKLSGLKPYLDIDIVITGLRPGEKLYEELLTSSSKVLPTYHDKICISKVPTYSYDHMVNFHIELGVQVENRDEIGIVSLLKEYIPEFKSNNSVYQYLDKP